MAVAEETLSVKTVASSHFELVARLSQAIDLLALERVASRLRQAQRDGASVFVTGNGGSAATAAHMATDFSNMTRRAGQAPLRVFSLCDNAAVMTANANDEGYERSFTAQLETYLRPQDVLIAISASGNSPNLLSAVRLAGQRGVTTVGILGFNGGALKDMVDECVLVPSEVGAYAPVEDVHLMISHALTLWLARQ